MHLSLKEYKDILSFYNVNYYHKTKLDIYKTAEDILANKLCRCIHKISDSLPKKDYKSSIAICKNSVLGKKGVSIKGFRCKKNIRILSNKTRKLLKKSN